MEERELIEVERVRKTQASVELQRLSLLEEINLDTKIKSLLVEGGG